MAIKYKTGKTPFYTHGDSLTEEEHKNSCDVNLMLKNAARGVQIRHRNPASYGYDDTTIDGVRFRIEKDRLEKELSQSAKTEMPEEAFEKMDPKIREKFGFKAKAKDQKAPKNKNDESNDDSQKGAPGQNRADSDPQQTRREYPPGAQGGTPPQPPSKKT